MLNLLPVNCINSPLAGQHDGCGLTFLHQLAETLGNAVDARDANTALHSLQVAEVSLLLAEEIGVTRQLISMIHIAGHLHDIGKIGIPDAILNKDGPLTGEERSIMQRHPVIGAQIVAPVALCAVPGGIAEIILYHHERFDGRGYPGEKSGIDIPIGARIVAVADTWSALVQNRPYRNGVSTPRAADEIRRCSGTQFDPVVVDAFLVKYAEGGLDPLVALAESAAM